MGHVVKKPVGLGQSLAASMNFTIRARTLMDKHATEASKRYQVREFDEDGTNTLLNVMLELQRATPGVQKTGRRMAHTVLGALASAQP